MSSSSAEESGGSTIHRKLQHMARQLPNGYRSRGGGGGSHSNHPHSFQKDGHFNKRSRTEGNGENKKANSSHVGNSSTVANGNSTSGESVSVSGGVIPQITVEQMGGLEKELPMIKELIFLPIQMPHLFSRLGADPPCGVLLHGPPGVGKTKLVHAIAGTLQVPLFFVSGPEIVSGISGDSEAKLRTLFMSAIECAPSIVFIDEIDTIAGRRDDGNRGMENRIVGQLLTCMDQVSQAWRQDSKVVCVMGATNRPEALDSALRRAGRFDREIGLGIPSLHERISILKLLCEKIVLSSDVDFFELANMSPGFVGADLHLLVKEACIVAIRRKHAELLESGELENPNAASLEHFKLTGADLIDASARVQPSAMREGFTTIPNVTWKEVGALEEVREELMACILQPIRAPKLHHRFGLHHPVGVLLYGPPGCGKTLLAKAIANQSGANFISIKGPELLNKFVGESERSVRMVFARGRDSAPCVLFFDELDALAPRRGSDRTNPSSERVVNQLLTELDGVEGRKDVYVIGATNRPDMIDPAMLRPGRLDKLLYVPFPSASQRGSILATHACHYPVDPAVNILAFAEREEMEGFSGADLAAFMREASLSALREVYHSCSEEELEALERDLTGELVGSVSLPTITEKHFEKSLLKVKPSVSLQDRMKYEALKDQISQSVKQGS